MAWIEYGVVDLTPVPGRVLIGVGNVGPEADGLSLADLHRPVPQDEPQRPPQDKDVFLYTLIMLVRGMAALRVKLNVLLLKNNLEKRCRKW